MALLEPDKFMARLRMGFSLSGVIAGKTPLGKRVARLGSREGFLSHCRENPDWGREAMALIEKNNAAAQARKGAPWRYGETCRKGHPFSGDNLGVHSSTGRKYCIACNKLAHTRGAEMTPRKLAGVRNAVLAGKTINEFTKGPGFVCTFATLKQYRLAHPEFDRFIIDHSPNLYSQGGIIRAGLVKENVGLFFLKARAVVRVTRPDVAPPEDIPPYVYQEGDHEWVSSLVPRAIPRHKREDVIQSAFEALLSLRVSRAGLPAMIKKLITAENRLHPTLAFGGIGTPFSLDAAIFDDGPATLGDRISRGLWD